MCQEIENSPGGLSAGVIIGNAFTDVPDLQSNVLVTSDGDPDRARLEAERIGRFMWEHRELFQAELTPLDEAIRIAEASPGLTVFSDAADATASGASGDSNAILKGLIAHNYSRRGSHSDRGCACGREGMGDWRGPHGRVLARWRLRSLSVSTSRGSGENRRALRRDFSVRGWNTGAWRSGGYSGCRRSLDPRHRAARFRGGAEGVSGS